MLVKELTAAVVKSVSKKDFNVAPKISTALSQLEKKVNYFCQTVNFGFTAD